MIIVAILLVAFLAFYLGAGLFVRRYLERTL